MHCKRRGCGRAAYRGDYALGLRDSPLDIDNAEARERELLLEASDGQSIGRVGPLRISIASREEFPEHW
jgi:hypothetical protein